MTGIEERIRSTQARYNAFSAILPAPGAAATGSLAGLAVSVKDILDVAGTPTRWGSRSLESAPPAAADCAAVARLRAAGATIAAKTTTSEFAHSPLGGAPLTGLTLNPWNPGFTCGGSSAGAGVAVATGATPIALATDAGCSTRLPASLTGTFGLKPTLGLIPHEKLPEGFATIVHLGLITATVDLMRRALAVVAGPHSADPLSGTRPPLPAEGLAGKRVLLWYRVGNAEIDEEVRAATADAAATLADLGATVIEADYPLDNPDPTWAPLQQVGWAARFGSAAPEVRALLSPTLLAGIEAGAALSGVALNQALTRRTAFYRGVQAAFGAADFILTPCASAPAVAAEHPADAPLVLAGREVGSLRREWIPYLSLFNLTGHPAIALPAARDRNGVPIGVQLVAPWHGEAALLAAAAAWERIRPFPSFTP